MQKYTNIEIRNIRLQTLLKQAKFNKKRARDYSFNYKKSVFDLNRYSLFFKLYKED